MTSSVWHPFTQHGLDEAIPHVVRGDGAVLHGADGSTLIDAISSWWVITHGHADPRIAAAIARQAETLDQLIFAGYTHGPAEDVAARLVAIAPAGLTRVFFSDSGSTAVEVAIKMALGYWHRRGEPRHRLLVMEHGYHGDTVGGMSLGARGTFSRGYEPLLFDVGTIPYPAEGREQVTLDALESACRASPAPAAFVLEPLVLGSGGMLFYSAKTLRQIADICQRHGVLLIADEVMTGWGRTGTRFACEQAGVAPDILCLAKGLTGGALPLAVTLASEAIFAAHRTGDRADMFFHSSSFTANPIACAAAVANLDIWDDEDVLERVATLGAELDRGLATLTGYPNLSGFRRIGGIAAMEIAAEDAGYLSTLAPRLRAHFLTRGILLRPLGNTIYLMPPYCTTVDQLAQAFDAIGEAAAMLR